MVEYNFCPKCGGKIDVGSEPPHCFTCGIIYYRNAKPCSSVLIVKDGRVLLGRRRNEPYKGECDIIGGFMEADELPEDAAIREAREETGLEVKIISLVGMYSGQYGEGGDPVLDILYTGESIRGEMKPLDDISSLEWVDIDKVPLDSGSPNTRAGLRDLKQLFEKGEV